MYTYGAMVRYGKEALWLGIVKRWSVLPRIVTVLGYFACPLEAI